MGPLVVASGDSVTIQGDGVLDGQGAQYRDGQGSNEGMTKPKFFSVQSLNNGNIKDIALLDTPVQTFSIQSNGLNMNNVTFDGRAGAAKGHNSDAFDISSGSGITISGCVMYNQDDCVAINAGSDIDIFNISCTGGHGLSIGSVGDRSANEVSNISIRNPTITSSKNDLRIKTVSGAWQREERDVVRHWVARD